MSDQPMAPRRRWTPRTAVAACCLTLILAALMAGLTTRTSGSSSSSDRIPDAIERAMARSQSAAERSEGERIAGLNSDIRADTVRHLAGENVLAALNHGSAPCLVAVVETPAGPFTSISCDHGDEDALYISQAWREDPDDNSSTLLGRTVVVSIDGGVVDWPGSPDRDMAPEKDVFIVEALAGDLPAEVGVAVDGRRKPFRTPSGVESR
jgi:hypothetical protein